jgi:hypothetical protein
MRLNRYIPVIIVPLALALSGCTTFTNVLSALTGTSPQVTTTVYALDQAYSVADSVVANAINSGLVKSAGTIANLKKYSQTAHDALKAASQAEQSGASNASALYAAAATAITTFENAATAAGIVLPATSAVPATSTTTAPATGS